MARALEEAGELIWECFLLPGEYTLRLLIEGAPGLAGAAGLASLEPGSMPVRIVSGVLWVMALCTSIWVWTLIRDVDRALTAWVADCHARMQRSLRLARRLLVCTLRRAGRKPQRPEWSPAQKIELGALELALLRAQWLVVPGSSIAARDLAVGLRVSAGKVRHLLKRLTALGLVEVDHASGGEGYRLTTYGKLFVGSFATRREATASH